MATRIRRTPNQIRIIAQQRDETVKQILEKERAQLEAKTARLRAMRLAREAAAKTLT
jgi:hypothetical protein